MKMKKLRELLEDYNDDADVCVITYECNGEVKRYHRIVELQVLDWGASFELVVEKGGE
jgi:ribosomal protein L30E